MWGLELSAGVEVDSQFYFTLHNQNHKSHVFKFRRFTGLRNISKKHSVSKLSRSI